MLLLLVNVGVDPAAACVVIILGPGGVTAIPVPVAAELKPGLGWPAGVSGLTIAAGRMPAGDDDRAPTKSNLLLEVLLPVAAVLTAALLIVSEAADPCAIKLGDTPLFLLLIPS